MGVFSRAALFSSSVCRSSNRFRNSRYVICSMTSSGLEMPPVQNAFQMPSIWERMSPVSMLGVLLVVAEIVLVKVQHFDLPLDPHTNVVSQHQAQEFVTVNQDDLRLRATLDELFGVVVETAGRDEDALGDALSGHRTDERLNRLSVNRAVHRVLLRLNENLVKPQRVLVDASVNAFVAAPAKVFGGIGTRTAVAHRNKNIEYQPLK